MQWLDAGTTPALIFVGFLLFRLERRVFVIELKVLGANYLVRKGEKPETK